MSEKNDITLEILRKAIKRLPGRAVIIPSQIWLFLIKVDGELTGYIAEDGFLKFERPKEEKP